MKCITDCVFGILSADDYRATLEQITKQMISAKVDFLKSCPQFKNWSRSFLSKSIQFWHEVTYYKG